MAAINPQMGENQDGSSTAVGQDLDTGTRPFSSRTPVVGQGERGLDLMLDFCCGGSEQKEDDEESKGDGGGMQGVDGGGEDGCENACGSEGVAGVGTDDEEDCHWDGDEGFHGGGEG